MSTPLIVTLAVVVWCLVLIFAIALCQAAAEGDRQLQRRAGTGDVSADTNPVGPVGSETSLRVSDPTDAWDVYLACTEDGPEGGVL